MRFLYFSDLAAIDRGANELVTGQRPFPTETISASIVLVDQPPATATVESEPTRWPTPIILEKVIVVTVPVEIPVEVTREVPLEVTVIVERPVLVISPTGTATPGAAPGTVRICAHVSGATELYIGGLGIVSGGCQTFSFGIGQTSIAVQVNR